MAQKEISKAGVAVLPAFATTLVHAYSQLLRLEKTAHTFK